MSNETITVTLTVDEFRLLIEAIDSHRYWQVTPEQWRRSGYSVPRNCGECPTCEATEDTDVAESCANDTAEEAEARKAIIACDDLEAQLTACLVDDDDGDEVMA